MTDYSWGEPKVTFGFVNCNRLHYLKACVESVLSTTNDYTNKEFIVIDNASVEEGTEAFLCEMEEKGFTVVRRQARDPANEFAKGLNEIVQRSSGKYVVPLQADMQFYLTNGWLTEYVRACEENPSIGCITLDAQRNITNNSHKFGELFGGDYKFIYDLDKAPIAGAGDVFYPKEVLVWVGPWSEDNKNHEGGQDSETDMLLRSRRMLAGGAAPVYYCAVPIIPPAIAIYTDPRGTNARVRGTRRYGKYVAPVSNNRYYEYFDFQTAVQTWSNETIPVGIETVANPNGWEKMLDSSGNWLKNPIKPEFAQPGEWEELNDDKWEKDFLAAIDKGERLAASVDKTLRKMEQDAYMNEWLDE